MMKLVHITVHFEYTDFIEGLLDRHGITEYVRYSMIGGKDRDGKHFGSQVYPGSVTVYQAQVPADGIGALLEELRTFRDSKRAHHHLGAVVVPIEQVL